VRRRLASESCVGVLLRNDSTRLGHAVTSRGVWGQTAKYVIDKHLGLCFAINQGRIHDHPGMTLDCSEPGCVKLDMRAWVKKTLDEMPEDVDGTATSPAADHPFKIVDGIENLAKPPAEREHVTSPFGISSSPIALPKRKLQSNIARPKKWWQTASLNLCRGNISASSVTKLGCGSGPCGHCHWGPQECVG
jgi:hypothetical protein